MRKMTEADLLNRVMQWIRTSEFQLQYDLAINFVAMGHGWVEFDLQLWDGKTAYLETWVDRDGMAITIQDRSIEDDTVQDRYCIVPQILSER